MTRRQRAALGAFVLLKLVLHAAALPGYGYFRDELYYFACARHLAFGYVDHPPLSIALLALVRAVFGDSLVALRTVPALAGAAVVAITGLLVAEIGGGLFATALACLAVIAAPIVLAFDHIYSMNALDGLVWAASALLFLRALGQERLGPWVALGVLLGLGLENKLSVLWLGAGIAVALVATARAKLRTRGPYVAAAIALLLALPHAVWQWAHAFPTAEFARNALEHKYKAHSLGGLAAEIAMLMNPAAAAIAIAGVVAPFVLPRLRGARPLACIAATALVIVASSRSGKAEYLAAAFPLMFAPGAAAWEAMLARGAWRWARPVLPIAVAGVGAVALPLALPVLSVPRFVAYQAALGVAPSTTENKELSRLPQYYADMHGWTELVDAAEAAYARVPPNERAHAVVWAVTGGYGPAAAIDFFGPARGLPHAISGHNSYGLWGPGDADGTAVVLLGGKPEHFDGYFESLERVGTVECGDCMPYENHKPVYVGRHMLVPFATIWPEWKHYE